MSFFERRSTPSINTNPRPAYHREFSRLSGHPIFTWACDGVSLLFVSHEPEVAQNFANSLVESIYTPWCKYQAGLSPTLQEAR